MGLRKRLERQRKRLQKSREPKKESTVEPTNGILSLPTEIMFLILSKLDNTSFTNMGLTCRKWYSAGKEAPNSIKPSFKVKKMRSMTGEIENEEREESEDDEESEEPEEREEREESQIVFKQYNFTFASEIVCASFHCRTNLELDFILMNHERLETEELMLCLFDMEIDQEKLEEVFQLFHYAEINITNPNDILDDEKTAIICECLTKNLELTRVSAHFHLPYDVTHCFIYQVQEGMRPNLRRFSALYPFASLEIRELMSHIFVRENSESMSFCRRDIYDISFAVISFFTDNCFAVFPKRVRFIPLDLLE